MYGISDYLPTFCILQADSHKNKTISKQIHDMSKFNFKAYCEVIRRELQPFSLQSEDPGSDMTTIIKIIQEATLKHAPLNRLSRQKIKIKTKPWLTKALLK